MSGILAQFGMKAESAYGTPVTVDRFMEFNSETVRPVLGRLQSNGLRAGGSTVRNNTVPFVQGYEGAVEFEPLSKGFGFWLTHMLGTVTTSAAVDSAYTHTATVATTAGDSFTMQVGRPAVGGTVADPFTYAGGKVTQWELSCDDASLLRASLTVNAKGCSTGTALASASYPSGTVEPFAFVSASVSVNGTAVTNAKSFSCRVNNSVKTDRNFLGVVHAEPLRDGWVAGDWDLVLDYDGVTQYNRMVASTAGSIHGTIVATFQSPSLIGTATYPTITVTIPAARFDGDGPVVPGPGLLEHPIKGIITDDGTSSPITVAYKTLDATP